MTAMIHLARVHKPTAEIDPLYCPHCSCKLQLTLTPTEPDGVMSTPRMLPHRSREVTVMGNEGGDDTLLLETLEKRAILTALEKTGKPLVAAPMLGIGKTTLYRKMKEYGIPTSQKKRERQCQPKESVPSESPLG